MVTDTDIRITKVKPADLKTLLTLSRKTFLDAFAHLNSPENMATYLTNHLAEESLTAELNNPGSEFYFAELDGEPIGYLKINTGAAQSDLKEDEGLEIERIYISQDHQGKKIGHRFMEKAIKLAQKSNKTYVWLGVWDQNVRAIAFYQKNGFVQFGSHPFSLGADVQTDIMMKLELK